MTNIADAPKVAVIAGGGSGIGQACALELARQGWRLVLVGRDPAKLADTQEQVAAAGGEAQAFQGDVRDWDRMAALAEVVSDDGLDLLINSAGGQFIAPTAELTANGWRAVVDTNL